MPPKKVAKPKVAKPKTPKVAVLPANQRNVLEFVKESCDLNEETGVLETKILYSMDKSGKYHIWQGFIGISESDGSEDLVAVEDDHITERAPLSDEECGIIWTRHGQEGGKEQISAKTWVAGKNVGKANETTPFTQAILDMRTLYNKKIKKGDTTEKEELIASGTKMKIEDIINADKGWRVFPMAVHDVSKAKNWSKVEYPCDMQPKYDGTLAVTVYHPDMAEYLGEDALVDIYSRRREDVEGQEHILADLAKILDAHPGLYLVGELWKAGSGRQDISGVSRRLADSAKESSITLDYMVFDCFKLDEDKTWEERKADLNELREECKTSNCEYIKFIESTRVSNHDELEREYQNYLAQGLEGGIIRKLSGKYVPSLSKEYRTYEILKIKPRPDAEWNVVDFTQGSKGKEIGSIIWICEHILEDGTAKRFNVTPNNPETSRKAKFKYLSENRDIFDAEYKGQEMTITYDVLSNDGLPQQPKALYFKDPKIEAKLSLDSMKYSED
jgi:DNA ligase-1